MYHGTLLLPIAMAFESFLAAPDKSYCPARLSIMVHSLLVLPEISPRSFRSDPQRQDRAQLLPFAFSPPMISPNPAASFYHILPSLESTITRTKCPRLKLWTLDGQAPWTHESKLKCVFPFIHASRHSLAGIIDRARNYPRREPSFPLSALAFPATPLRSSVVDDATSPKPHVSSA